MTSACRAAAGIAALTVLPLPALPAQASARAALFDSITHERRALQRHDIGSGLMQLALARQLYRVGDPVEGRGALAAAAADTTPAASKAVFAEMLLGMPGMRWGKAHWDSLPPADRSRYFLFLWDDCDADNLWREGECLRKQMRREAYADDHFRCSGDTDSSR